jgi:YebC/PmpR family DNA-binding regulatory protein
MSGHSKWSTIKHKKAASDQKRGKVFTKLSRALMSAARQGGPDPDMNADLRLAIDKAKAQNMPNDNIERAIKRGSGDLDGAHYENVTYEGYGPGGVAVFVEAMTDNRNRTVAELRHAFNKANGNLGQDGCVAWMFDALGQIALPAKGIDEDELLMAAVDGGADNLVREDDEFVITCPPDRLMPLKRALEAAGYTQIATAELTRVPQNLIRVEGDEAVQVFKLLTTLEDNDDVQQVFANADLDDDVIAGLQ